MIASTRTTMEPDHEAHRHGTSSQRERDVLWDMEEQFWTSGADSARSSTAANAVMIFPYPPGILQGEPIWAHLRRRTGWRSVIMADRRTTRVGDIAILTYRASAEKPGVPVFEALCASTYLHDDDRWLRLSHQQTIVT
jgi:hypothetical protein